MTTPRQYAPNRIKELRKAAGLSLEELGARMSSELTASTVAKLENRRMALSLDYITEISRVLGVPPSTILEGNALSGVRYVPVAGAIAAGHWQEAVALTEEAIAVPAHLEGENIFALRPRGDSMNLIVQDGGFIVVNPDDRDLADRKYYAIQNGDGETTFKQFRADPMRLVPCSTNPEYKEIPLGTEPFVVIGRVIYVGQEL